MEKHVGYTGLEKSNVLRLWGTGKGEGSSGSVRFSRERKMIIQLGDPYYTRHEGHHQDRPYVPVEI